MYDVQLCTYVVHARYIPVTSDLRMRNRHVEVAVFFLQRASFSADGGLITCKRGSAKHNVKDYHAFLWEHAIFRYPPSRNPSTDQDEILHD